MTEVVFVGVGEAFDDDGFNNSHLINSRTKLLLDCGYAIPVHFWRHYPDPEFLDAVFLSHTHADHYFGLPLLLLKCWEQGRKRPLTVLGRHGIQEQVASLTTQAYAGLYTKLGFRLEFVQITEGDKIPLNELALEFAASTHSVDNLAVRIQCGHHSVCYSGDGMFTDATMELYAGADLLIHEAYTMEPEFATHANVRDVVAMAVKVGVRNLALTHLKEPLRRERKRVVKYLERQSGIHAFVPEPMETFELI